MFDNADEKLKNVIRIFFWISTVASVVGFLIFTFNTVLGYIHRDGGTGIIYFLWIVFGLMISAFFVCIAYSISLLIMLYLNLVNVSKSILCSLDNINEELKKNDISIKENATKESSNGIIKNESRKLGEWKCVNCGKVNTNYVGICDCGQRRLY